MILLRRSSGAAGTCSRKRRRTLCLLAFALLIPCRSSLLAQASQTPSRDAYPEAQQAGNEPSGQREKHDGAGPSEPKTDITLLVGSDFVRPGALPRANLSLGIGHVFDALKRDPLGDGITFGYTYENTGTHGWVHTRFGEHSELLGQMRDFRLPHTEKLAAYNWLQAGLSSLTGNADVHNRFSVNEAVGLKLHLTRSDALWFQESYNKVVTIPWYTITSLGYTYSF